MLAVTDNPLVQAGATTTAEKASGRPVTTGPVNGATFRDLLNAGMAWLDRHHEIVNALNVFPVPDGDTGTNMLLTMRSACQEITPENTDSLGEVVKAAAHGALMGARGNSGVILSQILRGMARRLEGETLLTGQNFAAALTEGTRVAYKGVNRPVEGTILTVVREAATAAENAAELDPDLFFVLERTVRAADESVANTPRLLPVLAQANKVDARGKGLFYILEGIYRALRGEAGAPVITPAVPPTPAPRALKGQRKLPPLVYGFDVQFLVEGPALDVQTIRERITAMGDCPLVEGDEHLVKVHVHVPDPGSVLSYAVTLGFVTDVVVENMDDMFIPEMPKGYDPVPPRFSPPGAYQPVEGMAAAPLPFSAAGQFAAPGRPGSEPIEGPAIVTVAPGLGLGKVFLSLGAHKIVPGGQTMNPSTQELLQAIEEVPGDQVIILPNNANIIMAAQQAQALTRKNVAVVPSKSVPQGISALLALNPRADLDQNVRAMTAAVGQVQTGEVTTAVQQARFKDIHVQAGDMIGLLNDELTATGPTCEAVVKTLLEQMGAADLEVITIYYGEPVTADQAQALQAELRTIYPKQEIEVVEGNQPFYHYIISAE